MVAPDNWSRFKVSFSWSSVLMTRMYFLKKETRNLHNHPVTQSLYDLARISHSSGDGRREQIRFLRRWYSTDTCKGTVTNYLPFLKTTLSRYQTRTFLTTVEQTWLGVGTCQETVCGSLFTRCNSAARASTTVNWISAWRILPWVELTKCNWSYQV